MRTIATVFRGTEKNFSLLLTAPIHYEEVRKLYDDFDSLHKSFGRGRGLVLQFVIGFFTNWGRFRFCVSVPTRLRSFSTDKVLRGGEQLER